MKGKELKNSIMEFVTESSRKIAEYTSPATHRLRKDFYINEEKGIKIKVAVDEYEIAFSVYTGSAVPFYNVVDSYKVDEIFNNFEYQWARLQRLVGQAVEKNMENFTEDRDTLSSDVYEDCKALLDKENELYNSLI